MNRNVRLGWIAEAEARRFEESGITQHGLSEPPIAVVETTPIKAQGHWVRRLLARFAAGSASAPSAPLDRKIAKIRGLHRPGWRGRARWTK